MPILALLRNHTQDWSQPAEWIPSILAGDERALAFHIWQGSEGLINPRYLTGLWLFCSQYQLLVRVEEPYSLERAQDLATDLRASLSQQNVSVIVMLYQDPDEHWGRMFVEGVTVVLQIMAAVSLFLSVLLVVVMAIATLASVSPARSAAGVSVRQSLSYG